MHMGWIQLSWFLLLVFSLIILNLHPLLSHAVCFNMIRENALNPSHADRKGIFLGEIEKKQSGSETVIAVLQQISSKWLLFFKHLFRSGSGFSLAHSCLIAL